MFSTPPERLDGLKGAHQDTETPPLRADELPQGTPEDQKECPTTYFIRFSKATLTEEARDDQIALQKHIKVFWANATTVVESTVDAAKKKGLLDEKDLIKGASYRAKCFDHYVRNRTTWLEAGKEHTKTKDLKLKRAEFHTVILLAMLEGLTVPESAFAQLEKIITAVGDGIVKIEAVNSLEAVTFWISMSLYTYQPLTSTVEAKIRTIFSQSNENTFKVTVSKNKLEKIDLAFSYQQYDAAFNDEIFGQLVGKISPDLVDKGSSMIANSTVDVPIG